MKKTFLVLVLVLFLVPAAVYGEGTTVLLGAQSVSFGADLGKYYDVPPGPGIAVMFGLDLGILVDIRAGRRSTTEGNSDDDLTYQWIELGPRFSVGARGTTMQPDLFFGIGSYDLEIGDVEYDTAFGSYLGLGIEEILSEKYLGRIEIKSVFWKSDTLQTDGASLNLSLMFGYKF